MTFDDLIAEAEAAPITGWDFSWLEGRATEERPSWGYAGLVAAAARTASKMLDLQSGGGELLAGLPNRPPLLVAAEGWPPNVRVAADRLRPLAVRVVAADDGPGLPFAGDAFDLVTSRHPVAAWWDEVARVLAPGGTYLSQQVGPQSMREVSEYFLGPLSHGSGREPEQARLAAASAGLEVQELRDERLAATFDDVGAVVYFLRLVVWIVPGFTVEHYRERLRALDEEIQRNGPFRATASRFLIRATKPA